MDVMRLYIRKQISKMVCKRAVTGLLVMALIACLCACGKASNSSLQEKGQHVVDLMQEKANSDFFTDVMFSTSYRDNEYLKQFKKMDYDKPKKCYRLKLDDKFIEKLLEVEDIDGDEFFEISEELQNTVRSQIMSSFVTSMNSKNNGYETVLAASVLNAGYMFVDKSLANARETLLFIYEDAYPILVSLHGSKDGAVSASGMVIFIEDFKGDSVEDVKESFIKYVHADEAEDLLEDYFSVEKLK